VRINKVVDWKVEELENLSKVRADYPDAYYVTGRLYRVSKLLGEPTSFVVDGGELIPCHKYGDEEDAIFVVDRFRGMGPETLVHRLFKTHPELVLKAMEWDRQ
jgi:hypothetical protein